MPNRFFTKNAGLVVALPVSMLFLAASYFANPRPVVVLTPNVVSVQTDCAATTDATIIQEIRNSLQKAFPSAAERKKYLTFNFDCVGGVITLTGGVEGAVRYLKVLKAIKGIPHATCIKLLDVKNFEPKALGGCDDDTQRDCNGICISKTAACNEIG